MLELGASFQAKSYWDNNWKNPKLDSPRGVHNLNQEQGTTQWWEVDMPGNDHYTFTDMTLQKRGDGCCHDRTISAVRFQYSKDGNNWEWYDGGRYVATGQEPNTPKNEKIKFAIDPPIEGANKVRVMIDRSKSNHNHYQGRFDLWAYKEE